MSSRSCLQDALNHRSGAIPVDFGSTSVTGMHVSIVAELREYYGLEKKPVKVHEPYQMLGLIENDLLEAMGVDVVGVYPEKTMFGFSNHDWRSWKTPWEQDVLVSAEFRTTVYADGELYIYPQGDLSAPASGRMPKGGYFFDTIIRQEEIDEDNLDPEDNLEEFTLLTPEDLAYFETEINRASTSGRGVIAGFGGTAFGDIALVPAPFMKYPKGIRDISEWYMAIAAYPEYIHSVFERQCEIALLNLANIALLAGDKIDAVFICGTDFGTQNASFCSTETFDELYLPYYRRVNDWIHANTTWKTFKHSCGAVASFMPHFIDAGFDIINPVQCSAAGMDPELLKREFGDSLVFWGAGSNTQQTLPFGTPEEVRKEVLERCRIFGENGGFVFDAIHNVQAKTPIQNVVAMLEAVNEFNTAGADAR